MNIFVLKPVDLRKLGHSSKKENAFFMHLEGLKGSNPLPTKLFNLNFHPLGVVSRERDPQFQVSENYSDLTKLRSTIFKSYRFIS